MSIFDIFKKSKKESKKLEAKETQKKTTQKETPKKQTADIKKQSLDEVLRPQAPAQKQASSERAKRVEKKQFSDAYKILTSPHVTEKSGLLAEQNSYVFKVSPSANKQEIKKAVQDLYGVAIQKVAVINIPRKARRLGRNQGFKSGYRKAMVKLAEGEKIEIMPR